MIAVYPPICQIQPIDAVRIGRGRIERPALVVCPDHVRRQALPADIDDVS